MIQITEDEIALGRIQKTLGKLIRDLSGELGLSPADVPTYQPIILLAFLVVWHDGQEYQKSDAKNRWDDDEDLTPTVNVYDHRTKSSNGKKRLKKR